MAAMLAPSPSWPEAAATAPAAAAAAAAGGVAGQEPAGAGAAMEEADVVAVGARHNGAIAPTVLPVGLGLRGVVGRGVAGVEESEAPGNACCGVCGGATAGAGACSGGWGGGDDARS